MVSSPPAGPSPEELQLTGLLGLINPESLESVVAHALNHRAEVSPNIRRELDSVIRDFVKISGFKNSDRAPAAQAKGASPSPAVSSSFRTCLQRNSKNLGRIARRPDGGSQCASPVKGCRSRLP